MPNMNSSKEYDFVIIGSGFGGSVSAMRLAQKGYSVAILEMGKNYTNADFPPTNWHVRKYLWMPQFFCHGIQKITLLKKIMILHGIGVGGGSLVYANTLMKPADAIFKSDLWPKEVNWLDELHSHFETAKKMLGVVTNPFICANERALRDIGKALHAEDTFHATEVGIFFGDRPEMKEHEEIADPYFNGSGPRRTACKACGSCMIGCPTGAKNTLDKNYLYFAKKWGAKIFSETEATKIIPHNDGTYSVETASSTKFLRPSSKTFKAKNIVLSAGVLGTIDLLLKNRDCHKTLPRLSSTLGRGIRTNGESLLGATSLDPTIDYSQGIAIGAAIHPDPETKIEGVRYPTGSGVLRWSAVPLTENGNAFIRPLKLLVNCFIKLPSILRLLTVGDWARSTVILLVMQSTESKLRLKLGRPIWWPFKKVLQGSAEGLSLPSYLPIAQETCKVLARNMKGFAQNVSSEVLLRSPATAHILGGAPIGNNIESGVVDINHEVFGYKGLYVCDASIIPANLAVNPSLTITALSERFATKFPLIPGSEKNII